jgi:hypothetical protein
MVRWQKPAEFDKPLSEKEPKERQLRLSLFSPHHVPDTYRREHQQCFMSGRGGTQSACGAVGDKAQERMRIQSDEGGVPSRRLGTPE